MRVACQCKRKPPMWSRLGMGVLAAGQRATVERLGCTPSGGRLWYSMQPGFVCHALCLGGGRPFAVFVSLRSLSHSEPAAGFFHDATTVLVVVRGFRIGGSTVFRNCRAHAVPGSRVSLALALEECRV